MPDDLRFAFGMNWQSFRERALTDARIAEAERALGGLVGPLEGKTFLDIGSGSGLHSLVALRLGAASVVSFDYDADSVACTEAMREQAPEDFKARWRVLRGSVLDEEFIASLPVSDVVYSWGVLHHTGEMWRAIDLASRPVKPGGGRFALAIYNRVRGKLGTFSSESWEAIKRTYNQGGPVRRELMLGVYVAWRMSIPLSRLQNPLREIREYRKHRGMSWTHDARDWLGGYPYEYARPDEIARFVEARGFVTEKTNAVDPDGWGCNELVFRRG